MCFCGFLYQSYDLHYDYMSGKTVANIKVETILNQTLPAITICYPSYYSTEKIDDRNDPTLMELKQNYLDLEILVNKYRNKENLTRKSQTIFIQTRKI